MAPTITGAALTTPVAPGSYWRVSAEEDDSIFLTPEGLARKIRENLAERTPFLVVIPPVTDGTSDVVTFDMRAKDSIASYRVTDLVAGWPTYYPHSVLTRLELIPKRPTTTQAQADVASQQIAEAGKPGALGGTWQRLTDALKQAGLNATQTGLAALAIVAVALAIGYAVYKRID